MSRRTRKRPLGLALALLALELGDHSRLSAANPDDRSAAEGVPGSSSGATRDRQRALDLFAAGKRLEALPLLEKVEQKQPRDSQVLVALAASLVEHAATLSDQRAVAQERSRAKELLQKAFELGDTSPLEENLRQLLDALPTDGTIQFSTDPAVQKAMNAGEAAFARRDFDIALQQYGQALKLDPTNYYAALFTANTFDRQGKTDQASEWYQRATALNPDVETAYRYYADMLAKHGDMAKARDMLIRAAVAEPYNKIVWREIRAWAIINHTEFNIVYLPIPQLQAASAAGKAPGIVASWKAYYTVKAHWRDGDAFHKHFPQEPAYRHSLAEESEALSAAAGMLQNVKADASGARALSADPIAPLLLRLYDGGLIDAYVLFSLGDEGIAKDYAAYRTQHRDKLEAYLDRFVMPQLAH